jgi:hypothetical protein
LYDFITDTEGEVSIYENDIIVIIEIGNDGWSTIKFNNQIGLVPSDYFKEFYDE